MENNDKVRKEQIAICDKFNTAFYETQDSLKVGISKNVLNGVKPINGLRQPKAEGTSGWYIWGGEYSEDPNFFEPMHIKHLYELCPLIVKYLALPPGWRFLITKDYEDVWQDLNLLQVDF